MSDTAKLYDIIRAPIVTEKATMASEHNAVVFEVLPARTVVRAEGEPGIY